MAVQPLFLNNLFTRSTEGAESISSGHDEMRSAVSQGVQRVKQRIDLHSIAV